MNKDQKIFYFKNFKIYHGGNSLKISTDAILIGAWAQKKQNANHILDIGTGSGVISFMLSGSFKDSKIFGIELNTLSAEQCYENLKLNPQIQNIQFINEDLRKWESPHSFDLIVSNPPFFSNSLKPQNETLTQAKHDISLSPDDIFDFASKKLTVEGSLFLIYPANVADTVINKANEYNLHLKARANVFPNISSGIKRVMLEFSLKPIEKPIIEEIFIEKDKRHEYHESYINLCKDFYLKF